MNKRKLIMSCLLLFSVVLLISSNTVRYGDDIYGILTNWRNDTLGGNYRDFTNTQIIVEKLCIQDKELSEIIGILGKPNKFSIDKNNDYQSIEYFTETKMAMNIESLDSMDYCKAVFIKAKKGNFNTDFSYICK